MKKNSLTSHQDKGNQQDPDRSKKMLQSVMDQSMKNLSTALNTNGTSLKTLSSAMAQFIQSVFHLPEGTDCKQTCAYCCHLRVGVSIAEAIIIFDQIQQNATDAGRTYLKQRVIQTAQSGNTLEEEWWLNSQTPCPFLDTEGQNLCMIYDLRPFSCRAYHSTDVSACQAGFEKSQRVKIPCFPFYRAFTDMYSTIFIKTLNEKGLFSYQVGFVSALSLLFETDNPSQLIDEWFDGKDIFKTAKLTR